MKNFLKVSPEQWVKERKIGQTSFIIKRTLVFALLLTPANLLVNYLLFYDKKFFRTGLIILIAILMSIYLSVNEWASLEYSYRKKAREEASES